MTSTRSGRRPTSTHTVAEAGLSSLHELGQLVHDLALDVLQYLLEHLRDWPVADVGYFGQPNEVVAVGFDDEIQSDWLVGRELKGSDWLAGADHTWLELPANSR